MPTAPSVPVDPYERIAQARAAAVDTVVDGISGERRLVNTHNAPQILAEIEAFAKLLAAPYITHMDGKSYLMEERGPGVTEAGTPFRSETVIVEQVYGLPTHHRPGICFDCSLVPAPSGWSAAERLASSAAPSEPVDSGLRGKQRSHNQPTDNKWRGAS